MGDLIDRKALLEEYDQKCTGECGICPHYENDYCNLIENAPTVEAVPVVHGEWIKGDLLFEGDTCSICNTRIYNTHGMNFCPNCGADMRTSAK